MFENAYQATKKWGPGSCFVTFYLLSISLIFTLFFYRVYTESFSGILENFTIRENLPLFVDSLFFAPPFETLLYNVFLTFVFCYFKCRPRTIIFAIALIFAFSHYANGWVAPFLVFIPGLAFSWNYYLCHRKKQYIWGFLSTTILHFAYNFTLCVVIPMIYVVIDIYYGINLIK